MRKHIFATLVVFLLLIGSDMAIGTIGHFVGSDENETIFDYFSQQETWIELAVVFVIALIITSILRFGFRLF